MKSYPKPYCLDRNGKGRAIMLYYWEEILSKLIKPVCRKLDKEYFLVEINLRRKKCLLFCNYNLHKTLIKEYLDFISKEKNSLSRKYHTLTLRDFNSEPIEQSMKTFCQIHGLKNVINEPTCYKTQTAPLELIWSWKINLKAFRTPVHLIPEYQISTEWPWLY